MLFYYNGLAVRGSANDRTRDWTIVFADYVFMAGEVFGINVRDRAFLCYSIPRSHLGAFSGGVLFQLIDKISDALKYSGMNSLVLRISTALISTAVTVTQVSDMNWTK